MYHIKLHVSYQTTCITYFPKVFRCPCSQGTDSACSRKSTQWKQVDEICMAQSADYTAGYWRYLVFSWCLRSLAKNPTSADSSITKPLCFLIFLLCWKTSNDFSKCLSYSFCWFKQWKSVGHTLHPYKKSCPHTWISATCSCTK
jgi:hypothetical protein